MTTEDQRELVRRGYDTISHRYRDDLGAPNPSTHEDIARYAGWVDELSTLLSPGARILDLGCGNGLPAAKLLVDRGFEVVGLDFSTVQIERARRLIPGATFVLADMTQWTGEPESFDAIVSFYALIRVPLDDQKHLIPKTAEWLRPAGFLLAIVGHQRWTGVEEYFGASMFWDHADSATYLRWLMEAGLNPLWHRYVPEGDSGHELVLAKKELL